VRAPHAATRVGTTVFLHLVIAVLVTAIHAFFWP
jgi:hypothetical protein